jgi:hypothetical protein
MPPFVSDCKLRSFFKVLRVIREPQKWPLCGIEIQCEPAPLRSPQNQPR